MKKERKKEKGRKKQILKKERKKETNKPLRKKGKERTKILRKRKENVLQKSGKGDTYT